MKPRLLDLYCGAGGCAVGYARAGFDVVGVDIKPQPRYPYEFIQADAIDYGLDLSFDGHDFDAVHASPPCQAHSHLRVARWYDHEHTDLIDATRELLSRLGVPYVIENVVGAPLRDPTLICGSSLGVGVRRHRLFESSFPLLVPPCVHHSKEPIQVNGHPGGVSQRDGSRGRGDTAAWREAMEIDWMTASELAQAIPPAYTELVGHQLMQHVKARAA